MKMNRIITGAAMVAGLALSGSASAAFQETQYAVHVTNFTSSIPGSNNGFTTLTYPITVESDNGKKALYYAQYIPFKHQTKDGEAYYYGIQPRASGKALVIFSLFGGKGSRVIDKEHCSGGADNLAIGGITCNKVSIPYHQGVTYNFTASLQQHSETENIWVGEVEDTSTGKKTQIGSWATPAAIGYPSGNAIGFIEDYVGIRSCADIPATTATFGKPIGRVENDDKVYEGTVNEAYGVGVCNGKVAFTSTKLPDNGLRVIQEQGVDE